MKCRKDSGRIALIRGVSPDVRYVGHCGDCGLATEPTSMASAHLALNAHYRGVVVKCNCADSCLICGRVRSAHGSDQECPIPPFDGWVERFVPSGCDCDSRPLATVVRLDSRRGCVCAECAPAHAAARKAALEAECKAAVKRKPKSR